MQNLTSFLSDNSPTIKSSILGAGGLFVASLSGDNTVALVSVILNFIFTVITHFANKKGKSGTQIESAPATE